MCFYIAVSALLQSTLAAEGGPTSSSSRRVAILDTILHERQRKKEKLEAVLFHEDTHSHDESKEKKTPKALVKKKESPRLLHAARESNGTVGAVIKPLECDPDIGIFACTGTTTERCVESQESSLGGFCETYVKKVHRALQTEYSLCLYVQEYDPINWECDGCENFNGTVGNYTCTRGPYDDGTFTDTVVVYEDGSYIASTCYRDADGTPFDESCMTLTNDVPDVSTAECTLDIDKVECNSCVMVDCPNSKFPAGQVNCTNINSVAFGDFCVVGFDAESLLAGELMPDSTPAPVESTQTSVNPTTAPVDSTPAPVDPTSDSYARSLLVPVVVAAMVGMASLLAIA